MLTKEVKEILEGIHFFLVEGLKDESLSGKVECLRRGLLMQLEGLRTVYPFLQFGSSMDPNANIRGSSTAISYLNVESQNANSSLMSTSSSSSINYSSTGCSNGSSSSTGYSGDGIVTSQNNNNSFGRKPAQNYEDFEDIESCSDITTTTTTTQSPRRRSSADLLSGDFLEERDEESYAEGVEPVSFRILVGKCNHHGILSKRSRSILPGVRNSKTFRCVLVGSLLYFYLKESDDKQKKVIDLNWYSLHESPSEDNKSYSRRKEFTFQLVSCDGKKTHTFFTSKKTSMERWIRCIRQAVSTSQERLIRSQKAPLIQPDENLSLTENDDDDEEEEFYEELNGEVLRERCSPRETSKLWKPPSVPFQSRTKQPKGADISDYYSVPEEVASQIQKHIYYNQQRKVPPERPPLPNILRDSLKRNRPLPQAPESLEGVDEGSEKNTEDEIYCEIDELSKVENNFRNSISEIDSSSLSKEIFDTINRRVPSSQEKSFLLRQNAVSASDENYDVPSDASSCPSWRLTRPSLSKAPSLPPKGTFSSQISDEDSEYKVPSATVRPESLYNVPSNLPVSVKAVDEQLSGRYDNTILSDESINEPVSDKTVSDCVNNNQQSASEDLKVYTESEEKMSKSDDMNTDLDHEKTGFEDEKRSKTDEEPKVNPSNSVKDLIAKLNQTRESAKTSQKPLCYNSFRESKLSASGFDNSFLVECKNKIEVSRSVKSIKDNLEKEKLKISLSDTRGTNQLRKREEMSSNDSMGTELCDKQILQIKNNLSTLDACSAQEDRVYIAKFAFVSSSPDGLSFNRGDEIVVKDYPSEERLWKAVIKGREGFVPKEYLRKKE